MGARAGCNGQGKRPGGGRQGGASRQTHLRHLSHAWATRLCELLPTLITFMGRMPGMSGNVCGGAGSGREMEPGPDGRAAVVEVRGRWPTCGGSGLLRRLGLELCRVAGWRPRQDGRVLLRTPRVGVNMPQAVHLSPREERAWDGRGVEGCGWERRARREGGQRGVAYEWRGRQRGRETGRSATTDGVAHPGISQPYVRAVGGNEGKKLGESRGAEVQPPTHNVLIPSLPCRGYRRRLEGGAGAACCRTARAGGGHRRGVVRPPEEA